jgi:hypothetical protein
MINKKSMAKWASCLLLSGAVAAPAMAQNNSGTFITTLEIIQGSTGNCNSVLNFGGFLLTKDWTGNVEVEMEWRGEPSADEDFTNVTVVADDEPTFAQAGIILIGTPSLAKCTFDGSDNTRDVLVNGVPFDTNGNGFEYVTLANDAGDEIVVTIREAYRSDVSQNVFSIWFEGEFLLNSDYRSKPGRYLSQPILVTLATD